MREENFDVDVCRYELGYYGPTYTRHRHTPHILAVVRRYLTMAKWVSTEVPYIFTFYLLSIYVTLCGNLIVLQS
jgi:hypothetical protein